eukprot:1137503-Amphidinium_carterae.1
MQCLVLSCVDANMSITLRESCWLQDERLEVDAIWGNRFTLSNESALQCDCWVEQCQNRLFISSYCYRFAMEVR